MKTDRAQMCSDPFGPAVIMVCAVIGLIVVGEVQSAMGSTTSATVSIGIIGRLMDFVMEYIIDAALTLVGGVVVKFFLKPWLRDRLTLAGP